MAGNFNSTRWNGHARRAACEECERRDVRSCRVCGRACLYEYRAPQSAISPAITLLGTGVWACRRCHGLTYASAQLRKTRALRMLFRPSEQMRECSAALQQVSDEMQRAPLGLRDENAIGRALFAGRAVVNSARYKYPSCQYKRRKRRAKAD